MASKTFSLANKVTLNSGHAMPQIQLGLYCMSGREAARSVGWALEAGYRGFDCAQMYGNEAEAGRALREGLTLASGLLSRGDVFYTTKLASNTRSVEEARASVRRSVKAAGLADPGRGEEEEEEESGAPAPYVDLFLLHSPYGGREARLASWSALEDAVIAGEVRSIGVSNYGVKHIEELMSSSPRIPPAVNQIEVHPFNTQVAIREACARHGILVEAYAPLARAERMGHPTVRRIAASKGVSEAQVLVRWSLQSGCVPLPKSVRRERMEENADVGGFELSEEEMRELDALDEGLVTDWDPTDAP